MCNWFYCEKEKCIVMGCCKNCDCSASEEVITTNNTEYPFRKGA